MSRYYEIPQISFERLIEDLEAKKIEGLVIEWCDREGNVADKSRGRPRIYDVESGNYAWIYRPCVFKRGVGIKFFGINCELPIFEKLKRHYGSITPIHEEDLGIMHIG